ncbi:MAG: RNA polymerase sigma factor [Phycisphaerae bacterium]|nr:RNA polymerase sigma factor [Phycisphaerae bacterium]
MEKSRGLQPARLIATHNGSLLRDTARAEARGSSGGTARAEARGSSGPRQVGRRTAGVIFGRIFAMNGSASPSNSSEMTSMSIDAESLRQLVAEAQQGDRIAADQLVREHEAWVRSAIYAVSGRADLVDDVAQQVWERAWTRLGTLKNPRQLRSWLYTIARNTAIDAGLAQQRQRTRAGQMDDRDGTHDRRQKGPAAAAAGNELQEALLQAVQALPALYREPFVLRHLEDWSYAQIGQVLGLPVESVETRLVRARRMLREMLQGKVE